MKKILLLFIFLFSTGVHSYVFDPDCIESLDRFKEDLWPEDLLNEEVALVEKGILAFNTKKKDKDFEEFAQFLEIPNDKLGKLRTDNGDYPISCNEIFFKTWQTGGSFMSPDDVGMAPLVNGIRSLMIFNEVIEFLEQGKIHEELVKARKWSFKDVTDQDI